MFCMILRVFLVLFSFYVLNSNAVAQAIDNTASFRIMTGDKYIRMHYENDYFTATDYYYTQGINIEMVDPTFRKFPLTKLLIAPKDGIRQFGISIEHNGYTPTSIESNEILYGDRPFAAALMLKTFSMTGDSVHRYRITSSLSLGVLGPAAGGYEMQKSIHSWIRGTEPRGWQHQIQNSLIINYEAGIEKNILQASKNFLMNGFTNARAGTLNTKFSTGLIFMFGRLNSSITSVFSKERRTLSQKERVNFHIYFQPMINAIVYDATLQGGLFNNNSPYTISSGEIERITFQGNYGAVFQYRSLFLEYFKTIISKEFETGLYHRWGGIRVGMNL